MAANWRSLNKVTVTTAGTPVRVTSTRTPCHAIMFQAAPANTGQTYIMDSNVAINTTTFAHCNGVLGVPTTTVIPSITAGAANAPDAINAADYWIDSAVNGEGVIVVLLEG